MSPKDLHNTVIDPEVPASMSANSDSSYWRHAAEFRGEVAVDTEKHQEFDAASPDFLDAAGRRNFMKVMGASMMMAGLTSCARQPEEKIVPYVKPPEASVPGRFEYFASAVSVAGFGMGVVATSYEGRPTKIEGLAEHPASLGSTGIHAQSSILDLYSPDRLQSITRAGTLATWNQFVADIARAMVAIDAAEGAGLTVLTETVTSPTIQGQMAQLLQRFPKMTWREHDPMGRNNVRLGALQAFGRYAETKIDFLKAKTVLSLDADFLHSGPAHVRYARDFAVTRSADASADAPDYVAREHFAHDEMSRLYVAECSPTLTGAAADNILTLRFPYVETLARTVAARIGIAGVAANPESASHLDSAWVDALVEDLLHSKGHAVVVAGESQPPVVHALAHAINGALGAVESGLVAYIDSPEADATDQQASLTKLVDDLNADRVQLLVVLGGNPIYNTPGNIELAAAFDKVALRVHLTPEQNETSELCHWVLPESHALESWGDIRAYDGTHSIVQPLIRPLYNSKSASQILAVLNGDEAMSAYDLVRARFTGLYGAESETAWKKALSTGIVEGSAFKPVALTARNSFADEAPYTPQEGLELVFRHDPHVADGRFANNGWLQELPKPLTKLTWDNALHIHPSTASLRELEQEDVVIIKVGEREVRAAVMLMFGHPQDVATLHLGYGRQVAGHIGKDRGFNAYVLQDGASPWYINSGVTVAKTGRTYLLARTEEHSNIEKSLQTQAEKAEDRHLIRTGTLETFKADPDFVKHMVHHQAPERGNTLYDPDEKDYAGLSWGMTIDLNRCTGCNVCTIACQAENNIPIVGKQDVKNGREMHWIRVDRYYKGDMYGESVEVAHQPVPCMQCENAPCEPVCPVGGTMHSEEGLNDMIYNRCVGTRYCANNCPYKVRRFNFFHYQVREGQDAPQLKMMRNPNVTVRSRGVMEKCTYCVQRINRARIDAKVAASKVGGETVVPDGTLVTACQAACPSQAIDFGNINDPDSRVSLRKQNKRDYGLLADIGTRPRTTYLAKLNNPSPKLGGGAAHAEAKPEH